MKKFWNVIVLVVTCLTLFGCGAKVNNDTPKAWVEKNENVCILVQSYELDVNAVIELYDMGFISKDRVVRLEKDIDILIKHIKKDKQSDKVTVSLQQAFIRKLSEQKSRLNDFKMGYKVDKSDINSFYNMLENTGAFNKKEASEISGNVFINSIDECSTHKLREKLR